MVIFAVAFLNDSESAEVFAAVVLCVLLIIGITVLFFDVIYRVLSIVDML